MKFILSCLFIAISFFGHGKCAYSSLTVWPGTEHIRQNSWFVLQGYGGFQEILDSVNLKYPVYLVAEDHEVKLTEINKYVSAFKLTQLVMRPEEDLHAGKTYKLVIDYLDKYDKDRLTRYDEIKDKYVPLTWYVLAGKDTTKPILKVPPTLKNKVVQWFGCGPAVNAIFTLQAQDGSDVVAFVEVQEIGKNIVNAFLVDFNNNEITVGQNMCSGAFVYERHKKYKVRFKLFDLCGNQSDEPTAWIDITSPYDK